MPLTVRPAPQFPVELDDEVERSGRLLGSDEIPDIPEQATDAILGWPDQELTPVLPDVRSEKVEPSLDVRDLRLLLREVETTFPKEGCYGGQDFLFQLLSRAAGNDKVVRITHHVDLRAEIPLTAG